MKLLVLLASLAFTAAVHIEGPLSGKESQVVGGKVAYPGSRPYQLWLQLKHNEGTMFYCGGVIIDEFWALTAGHCTTLCEDSAVNDVDAIAGAWDRTVNEDGQRTYRINCTDMYTHPDYNSVTLKGDLGLMYVQEGFEFSDLIKAISLPPPDASDHNMTAGDIVTYSGWGDTETGQLADILKVGTELVVSQSDCQLTYGAIIGDGKFCSSATANPDDSATCSGDSGGPVTYLDPGCVDRLEDISLVGLVSFGSSAGCVQGYSDGFTRLKYANNLDWIREMTGIKDTAIPSCRTL